MQRVGVHCAIQASPSRTIGPSLAVVLANGAGSLFRAGHIRLTTKLPSLFDSMATHASLQDPAGDRICRLKFDAPMFICQGDGASSAILKYWLR